MRNADGSLTGYFDWRPKDADEAITVAKSTDGGLTWTAEGEALEQNCGYCPTADTNDDGQGHPFVTRSMAPTTLYTLQRPAGDYLGIGLLVHIGANTVGTNPLSLSRRPSRSGIDPNTFATGPTTVPTDRRRPDRRHDAGNRRHSRSIVTGPTRTAGGTSEPSSSTIITCTGPTSAPGPPGPGARPAAPRRPAAR